MVRFKSLLCVSSLLLATLFLTSCTLKRPCPLCTGGGGGGGGSTTGVTATLAAAPLAPPAGTNILSFVVTITGVSLTPSGGGSAVNLNLPATSVTVDLMRLESDSTLLGQALSVPAATYSKVSVSASSVAVTYCTQVSPGTPGCSAGSVHQVAQAATVPAASSFSLIVSSGQVAGLQVQVNLANAITLSPTQPQVVSAVNLNASNVLTASVLPPAASSLASGQLDFIEDFTGIVTNVNATSQVLTIQTATRGTITATANSSTFFSPNCTSPPFNSTADIHCVVANDIASVDVALDANGSFTLLDYDPLDTTASDWIEGVVMLLPTSNTQFQIVANDLFQPSSGSLVGTKLPLGSTVTLNLSTSPGATFGVDERGLIVPAEANTFVSANDTSVLRAGQTVAVHLSTFTAASGSTPATATVDFVGLRFTRVTASVSSVAAPTSVSLATGSLPSFFGQTGIETAELNLASAPSTAPTNYDGIGSGTGLVVGDTVSIRALYFGPISAMPFSCAKVRKH